MVHDCVAYIWRNFHISFNPEGPVKEDKELDNISEGEKDQEAIMEIHPRTNMWVIRHQ